MYLRLRLPLRLHDEPLLVSLLRGTVLAAGLLSLLSSSPIQAQPVRTGAAPPPDSLDPPAALPDLAAVPVPAIDVFEPAVVRQLEDARSTVVTLVAARRPEALEAFGALCLLYLRYELYDAAAPCLGQARALAPRDFRWPYYQTFLYTRWGDLDRARSSASEALELRPSDLPALLRAGDLALLAVDIEDAESRYDAALGADPKSSAARFGLGRVAQARGDHAAAAARYQAALPGQPDGTVVHYHLGMALRALGDLEGASRELGRSRQVKIVFPDPLIDDLERMSESREAIFARGIELLRRNDPRGAVAAFRNVLEKDPDDAQAHYNLARASIELGALDEAETHLRRALGVWPDFFDAHLNLAILLGRAGRAEEAAEHIEAAVRIDPEHLPARMLLARVAAERGDSGRAITELEAILRLDPSTTEARLALASLVTGAGDVEAARRQLELTLEAASTNNRARAEAHRRLALLPGTTPAQAEEHLRNAIELDPASVDARFALAERLARDGEHAAAVTELERVVELEPNDSRVRLGLASELLLAGDERRARAALDAGVERLPDNLALQALLARVLATSSDPALRDGARATVLAESLVERQLTLEHVETLAMALAEAGRFEEAALWQRRAIDRQAVTGAAAQVSQRRLDLYLEGKPLREPWTDTLATPTRADPLRPR